MDLNLSRPHQARLDLVEGLKSFVAGRLVPAVRDDYETWVAKDALADEQLRDRKFMDQRFVQDPGYQASRGLQRISQEMMWREVFDALEPRRSQIQESLNRVADAGNGARGSLTLDNTLPMPGYYDKSEFHLQPGNYHRDELAGPVYEIGVATYTTHRYGKAGDEMGRALLSVIPDIPMSRTLYLGCGPGYKSYPIVDAFANAHHDAIDLAAPMLKFARHRSIEHGKPIHFHQMNAESLGFDDNQYDLVFCKLLLHEVPAKAIRQIVAEAARVLKPGGVFANLELPGYDRLDPLSAYLMDWDTAHNGEPFWRAYHELDLTDIFEQAGLQVNVVDAHSEWGGAKGNYMGKFAYQVTMGTKPEAR